MVKRTPSVGSVKDNMFAMVMYLACYGFSYYKAAPHQITMEVFDGMIDALCRCDRMKSFYKGKNCFDQKEIDKYVKGAARSQKKEYPMDWVFDFSYDLVIARGTVGQIGVPDELDVLGQPRIREFIRHTEYLAQPLDTVGAEHFHIHTF